MANELTVYFQQSWMTDLPAHLDPMSKDVDHLESWHASDAQKEHARLMGVEFVDLKETPPEVY